MKYSEFKKVFGFNKHRLDLLSCFETEYNIIQEYTSRHRVVVYGSFITNKETPSDIDILLESVHNGGSEYPPPFKFERQIQIRQRYPRLNRNYKLPTAKDMVLNFNNHKTNKEKDISIKDYIELTS